MLYEDPFSQCRQTDHPCTPGGPCYLDPEESCDPGCGDYFRYAEEDYDED